MREPQPKHTITRGSYQSGARQENPGLGTARHGLQGMGPDSTNMVSDDSGTVQDEYKLIVLSASGKATLKTIRVWWAELL